MAEPTSALNAVDFSRQCAVPSGVRNRVALMSIEDKGRGRVLMTARHTFEREGEEKPALVADTLVMITV